MEWAGGLQIRLAEKLEVSPAAVAKWRRTGIPPDRAIQIERLSKGRLRAVDLRDERCSASDSESRAA